MVTDSSHDGHNLLTMSPRSIVSNLNGLSELGRLFCTAGSTEVFSKSFAYSPMYGHICFNI